MEEGIIIPTAIIWGSTGGWTTPIATTT